MSDRDTPELQVNRLELVSRWADDLAHEIKNPLHAMVINLELVKRRAGGGDPQLIIDRAEVVESELHRVHALLDSLLRLVRPWPQVRTARVQEVFDALLPVFRARARIRQVDFVHDPGSAFVAIPPGHLAQVLVNLTDNAIDATDEGGRVTTAIETVDGSSVRVIVSDTGRGLPDGPIEALFDGGAGREGHSGLGLAISRQLVQHAGGSLSLEPAREGTGVRAVVTLPLTGSA